ATGLETGAGGVDIVDNVASTYTGIFDIVSGTVTAEKLSALGNGPGGANIIVDPTGILAPGAPIVVGNNPFAELELQFSGTITTPISLNTNATNSDAELETEEAP